MIFAIVALLLAGLVLLALEILTPTFGLLLAAGLAAFGGAVWLTHGLSPIAAVVLVAALVVGVPAYLVMLVRVLPRSPLGRRLFLQKARGGTGEGTPQAADYAALVGKTGTAETILRPTGAVRVNGHRVIASAESGMIQRGATVMVLRATGMNVVVREVEQKQ